MAALLQLQSLPAAAAALSSSSSSSSSSSAAAAAPCVAGLLLRRRQQPRTATSAFFGLRIAGGSRERERERPARDGRKGIRCAADGAVDLAQPVEVAEVAAPVEKEVANGAATSDVPIELRYDPYPTVLDINQIREILPHRFPFLLVDRVIELDAGKSAVGIKNVTINDQFFPGHFPERPIMPGVLMVEAMAQVGGIVMLNEEVGGSKQNFFFAGVDKVRFRKPVVAGDTLVMRMTLTKLQRRFGIAKMEGKAYVGKDVVCEGEFLMALG